MFKFSLKTVLLFLLISCGVHNKNSNNVASETLSVFRNSLSENNYQKAQYNLNHNSIYTNKKNTILKTLELGKLYHLQNKYDSSNIYFNEADLEMEEPKKYSYDGTQLDKILMHYYKALNYLYLNDNEGALVEAKRINIKINAMSEKGFFKPETKIDPFAQILQGIIYEKNGNYDDALLSYKDAITLYDKYGKMDYLGVPMPQQLIADVINTAQKANRADERDFYCKKFNVSYNDVKDTSKNKVLFFWENGISPIKKHQYFTLNLNKKNTLNLNFVSLSENVQIPLSLTNEDIKELLSSNINKVNVSYYVSIEPVNFYNNLSVNNHTINYNLNTIENIAQRMRIAPLTYSELNFEVNKLIKKEMNNRRVERIENKKRAEEQLTRKYKTVEDQRKKDETELAAMKSEDEKAKKIKEMDATKKKVDSEIANLKNQISNPKPNSNPNSLHYNRNTGSGDTRSWQSLPSSIAYSKIPMINGKNSLIINLSSAISKAKTDTILINSKSKLTVLNYTTMDHLPFNYDAFYPISN